MQISGISVAEEVQGLPKTRQRRKGAEEEAGYLSVREYDLKLQEKIYYQNN
jgi:hypothetical protein